MDTLRKVVSAAILLAMLTVCASLSNAAPEDEDGGQDLTAQENENGGVDLTAKPVILTVDGLNFATFGCEKEVFQDINEPPGQYFGEEPGVSPHVQACSLVGLVMRALNRPLNDPEYLNTDLKAICGAAGGIDAGQPQACGEFYYPGFYWNGDQRESRPAVEALKARIIKAAGDAWNKKKPFMIVAHSWGCILTAEALGEIEDFRLAPGLQVDKLVTIGNPLGGKKYQAAVLALIGSQKFFVQPKKAKSIGKWVNYWASRDIISGPLYIKDANIENHQIDADPKFDQAEIAIRKQISIFDPAGRKQAIADLDKLYVPQCTGLWHSIYVEGGGKIVLPSIQQTLDVVTYPIMLKELSSI